MTLNDSFLEDFSETRREPRFDSCASVSSDSTRDEVKEVLKLVNGDERKIFFWRFVVIAAMVIVGLAATWMTYTFLAKEERKSFENVFHQHSVAIIESSSFNARAIKESYNSFSDHMTSHALQKNATWPFFTMPSIHHHGSNLRSQTRSLAFVAMRIIEQQGKGAWENYTANNSPWDGRYNSFIFDVSGNLQPVPVDDAGPWGPVWEIDPPPLVPLYNFNILPSVYTSVAAMKILKESMFGVTLLTIDMLTLFPPEANRPPGENEPLSSYMIPVYNSFDRISAEIGGIMVGYLRWGLYFSDLLPDTVGGLILVLDSGSCGGYFSWRIDGKQAIFLGVGDLHDTKYDRYEMSTIFGSYEDPQRVFEAEACVYVVRVYPSSILEDKHTTKRPAIVAAAVAAVFVLVVFAFFAFDFFQTQRNEKIVETAAKTSAVVNAIFPAEFRDRMLMEGSQDAEYAEARTDRAKTKTYFASHNQLIRKFLDGSNENMLDNAAKPLAEFYPEVTVMFADIVGFTAWCSVREPSQVFTLLEMLYATYDDMAKRRRVFKVETVGDCYVAAAGLPEKRKDHAIVMARFAQACLSKTQALMQRLEIQLGPDTGDLTVRIGLHSGPITAGVLFGERARFQLFGDTMNIAARMESTGMPGRIHLSEETANLICAFQKQHWVQIRHETVSVKGKGNMQTYWLSTRIGTGEPNGKEGSTGGSDISSSGLDINDTHGDGSKKRDRLVDWHVDIFSNLLKQIVARRNATERASGQRKTRTDAYAGLAMNQDFMKPGMTCLDEVKEIITLPKFDRNVAKQEQDANLVELEPEVTSQLRDYILTIAHMYNSNAFHNFEHASHVTMSVNKLLSRIVMPSDLIYEGVEKNETHLRGKIASTLHDHTYGITSDPLTQFAVVFAALIHDVDHSGVPNVRLIKENPKLAKVFKNKSVAEQNSIVLAWDLLMDPSYPNLRSAIFSSPEERSRFRQLVVQTVLATDIADKELKTLRNARWEAAFHQPKEHEDPSITVNRKATIVIEHLIQASDIAHTMQHWHIYRKWNENFFCECYKAFLDGRSEQDPSLSWYEGEIGFFDFYIIPLAKKLKDCGVFGVASDEYLTYAQRNRQEWKERGEQIVAEMLHKFQEKEYKGKIDFEM